MNSWGLSAIILYGSILLGYLLSAQAHYVPKPRVTKEHGKVADVFCIHGNKTYPAGTHFRPDKCTHCHCRRHGNGRADCAVEDCRPREPHCLQYELTEQSECCETCTQYGCLDGAGTVYMAGDIVSYSPCQTCLCPDGGGGIQCTQVTCPDVSCVNPVMDADGCCHRCPDGPNCWLGSHVLSGGIIYRMSLRPCKICHCPETTDNSRMFNGPQAVCKIGARHCRKLPNVNGARVRRNIRNNLS